MRRKSYFVLATLLLVAPVIAFAAGLVPCGGTNEPVCQGCHFLVLIDNIFDWLVTILSVVFAIMIVSAGIKMVVSGGNPEAKTTAKKRVINAIIGFIIVLSAWLLVDFGLKALLDDGSTGGPALGPWNSIQCAVLPVAT